MVCTCFILCYTRFTSVFNSDILRDNIHAIPFRKRYRGGITNLQNGGNGIREIYMLLVPYGPAPYVSVSTVPYRKVNVLRIIFFSCMAVGVTYGGNYYSQERCMLVPGGNSGYGFFGVC